MSSHYPEPWRRPQRTRVASGLGATAFTLLLLAGCEDQQSLRDNAAARTAPTDVRTVDLVPGSLGQAPEPMMDNPYAGNLHAISEGKRLYSWFNCVGCHANGGGGMGPPLIDNQWIYGSEPAQIFATIVQGRPNGMPAFGGKIPEQDVWKLVAYVRSLGGLEQPLLPGASELPLQDEASANLKQSAEQKTVQQKNGQQKGGQH